MARGNFEKWAEGYESTGAFNGRQTMENSYKVALILKAKIGCGWRAMGEISGRLNQLAETNDDGENIINLNRL